SDYARNYQLAILTRSGQLHLASSEGQILHSVRIEDTESTKEYFIDRHSEVICSLTASGIIKVWKFSFSLSTVSCDLIKQFGPVSNGRIFLGNNFLAVVLRTSISIYSTCPDEISQE